MRERLSGTPKKFLNLNIFFLICWRPHMSNTKQFWSYCVVCSHNLNAAQLAHKVCVPPPSRILFSKPKIWYDYTWSKMKKKNMAIATTKIHCTTWKRTFFFFFRKSVQTCLFYFYLHLHWLASRLATFDSHHKSGTTRVSSAFHTHLKTKFHIQSCLSRAFSEQIIRTNSLLTDHRINL